MFSFKFDNQKYMNYGDFLKGVINEEEAGVYTIKEDW